MLSFRRMPAAIVRWTRATGVARANCFAGANCFARATDVARANCFARATDVARAFHSSD